jgi:hypothetical protein
MHEYELRPRKDHRGFDLISDALPFGRLWYTEIPHAIRLREVSQSSAKSEKSS